MLTFAVAAERKMLAVRAVLAAGFLPLIVLLLLDARPVQVAARVGPAGFLWWTLIVPLIPAFLLVFGHTAWRRVCPLSLLSQLPRLFGVQRRRRELDAESGTVQRKLVLIPGGAWLARNAMAVQLVLLACAVALRLVLINENARALGLFLALVVLTSLAVGVLFGGKTWCNFFCPISPVQRFYTEPRGLLEAPAHLSLKVISGSMCRTTDQSGREASACVGCKSPCPDVDLERAYWAELTNAPRQFAYYGYAGLVFGYIAFNRYGEHIHAPRAIAGPAAIAVSVLLGWGLGMLTERALASGARGRHQAFAITTFITFNVFYLFGVRLDLLPPWLRALVQFGVVVASSLWLVQALSRSAQKYERESLGKSLRKQLGKLRFDVARVLGGRTLEELDAEEVYLLSRALPELSAQQKRAAYKETLRESITSGSATSAAGAGVLRDLRLQLGVSEVEHGELLTELGVEDARLFDPDELQSQERWLQLESYREALEALVLDLVQHGKPVQEALASDAMRARVRTLQALYSIEPEDQKRVAAELAGAGGRLSRELAEVLARLGELKARAAALRLLEGTPAGPVTRGLQRLIARRRRESVQRGLNLLSASGATTDAMDAAEQLARLAPEEVQLALTEASGPGLRTWGEALSPGMAAVLGRHYPGDVAQPQPRLGPATALSAIIHEQEPIARASALQALVLVDPGLAQEEAAPLATDEAQHWLVRDTARAVMDGAANSTIERIQRLSEAELFEQLAPGALAELARESAERELPAGAPLCEQGAASTELLVLCRGDAEVEILRDGRRVPVARLAPGQVIGELGVLTQSPRSATVRAGASGATVVAIPGARLQALLLEDGRVASGLLRTVSERLTRTLAQLGR